MQQIRSVVEQWVATEPRAQKVLTSLKRMQADLMELKSMPVITINLMLKRTVDNDKFYQDITKQWHAEATARHTKFKVIGQQEYGVAVCILPRTYDEYFMHVEAAARRNVKKASRNGYRYELIDPAQHVDDIREIRQSTDVRQGKVADDLLYGDVTISKNPVSRNHYHGYPTFGVFKDDKLVAYSSCFVAGEVCSLEHTLGHADFQSDGIVPMMLCGIAETMYAKYPAVRYFVYGTFFGAAPPMRRFKKKFRFFPHRVLWKLDARETAE